jgi:hypothetical protein
MVNATNHNLWSSRPEILTYSGPVPISPGFQCMWGVSTISYPKTRPTSPSPHGLTVWPQPLTTATGFSLMAFLEIPASWPGHGWDPSSNPRCDTGFIWAYYGLILGPMGSSGLCGLYRSYIYIHMYESTSTKRREGLVELTMRSNLLSDRDWRVTKLLNNKPLIIFYQYTLHPTYIIYPSNSWVTCSFQSWLDMVLP